MKNTWKSIILVCGRLNDIMADILSEISPKAILVDMLDEILP
jgi:hypothetical protein